MGKKKKKKEKKKNGMKLSNLVRKFWNNGMEGKYPCLEVK